MRKESYLETAQREFRRLKGLADGALAQIDERELLVTLGSGEVSAAILMKHLAGNMLSRWLDFLTTDGEKPHRNRDSEFAVTLADTRPRLTERWERGWGCLFTALEELREEEMSREVLIRGEPHTVLQAIQRQLTHYAYHTGEIVLIAKCLAGPRWKTLSVPKGESRVFNEAPQPYLTEDT
ncbi:MAG: DUF1572 family protein [Candidatus Bipolaricaulota bacterium]|nr:MAG: DUF1572 family protein [Candidatus Bipolaricaulota bacterium]